MLRQHFALILFIVVKQSVQDTLNTTGSSLRHSQAQRMLKVELKSMSELQQIHEKSALEKQEKLSQLAGSLDTKPPFVNSNGRLEPESSGAQHNLEGPAILTVCLMCQHFSPFYARMFLLAARKSGYDGDLVIALSPGMTASFMDIVSQAKSVLYNIDLDCISRSSKRWLCEFKSNLSTVSVKWSIAVIRYKLYQYWASLYNPSAILMVTDFRDVTFQANPFTYMADRWTPPISNLAVFLEAYPNKEIERCPSTKRWVKICYGDAALKQIGLQTVSCSGVSMGSRDAILVYSYMMNQQLDHDARLGKGINPTGSNDNRCVRDEGSDQGFHNWLLYSGALDQIMDVTIFNQGQGIVMKRQCLFYV